MAQDLTKGPILLWVLRLAGPTLLAFLMQSFYALADLFFLGRLGEKVLAAFAISFNTLFLVLSLTMMLGVGSLSQIASFYGAGDFKGVGRVFSQTVLLAVVLGSMGWLLAGLVAPWYFAIFTKDAEVKALGVSFYRVYASAFLWQVFLFSMSQCWRAVGDFKTPMKLIGLSVVMNFILDPLFIFGWGPFNGWQMNGAAWATMTSQVVSGSVYVWLMLRSGEINRGRPLQLEMPLRPDWQQIGRTLRIGVPVGVQHLFFAMGIMAVYVALRPLGSTVVAGTVVGFRIFETSILPIISIGVAVSSMVGQNHGAGKWDRVWSSFRCGLLYSFLMAFLGCVLIGSGAGFLVGLFTDSPQVMSFGVTYAIINMLSLPAFAFIFSVNSLAVGLGRTGFSLAIGSVRIVTMSIWLIGSLLVWKSSFLAIFWANNIASFVQVGFAFWIQYHLRKKLVLLSASE